MKSDNCLLIKFPVKIYRYNSKNGFESFHFEVSKSLTRNL